jgi:beta-mannosidase
VATISFGRWKALQYYARRFYADLLVSPFAHDGTVDVYIVSDKVQPSVAQFRMRLLSFDGKALLDKTQAVQIPAQSSAVYLSVNQRKLIASAAADPDSTFLVFDLDAGGTRVLRNEVFFDRMRNLQLPQKPAIQSDAAGNGPDYSLTLRSRTPARNVYLSFGDLDVELSDNYFDLLPGEESTIHLTSSATLDQLQLALRVVSLSDAFFDERPTYREHASPDRIREK